MANITSAKQSSPSHICSACSLISVSDLKSAAGYLHLQNARKLPESAQACGLCRLILHDTLQKPETNHICPPVPYPDFSAVLEGLDVPADARVEIRLKWVNDFLDYLVVQEDGKGEWLHLPVGRDSLKMFKISASDDEALSLHQPGAMPEGSPVSEVLDLHHLAVLTNRWLKACTNSHPHCKSNRTDLDRSLPTRLIDVGEFDEVRLCDTSGQAGRYTALSYCWGNPLQLQTTKATISAHMNGIQLHHLPATCRDAVLVTRSLGLHYLWIDSLCIIQDDQADWACEAAKMGDVYSNAYITLAASRAMSSSAGFLGRRTKDEIVKICPIDAEPFYVGSRHSFARDTDRSPLARRAWVLQERVLSRRTLHFTSTQVYWECWTHHQGEDLDNLYLGVHKKDAYPGCLAPSADNNIRQSDEKLRTPVQWWHLLTSYTTCSLTYQKDKLVAISGLVNRISRQTGQRAIAGLFEDYLHPLLLWSACDTPLARSSELEFPSWSWTSRNGRINHVQLYDWAMNEDVQLVLPCTDHNAKLSATMRRLRPDVTYSGVEISSEYDVFPPELDYHVVRFRFVSPDWLEHDDSQLGWLTLDVDDGSTPDWSQLGWVVVACNLNVPDDKEGNEVKDEDEDSGNDNPPAGTTEGPFYCLLVRLVSDNIYERIGIGSVLDFEWFESFKQHIVVA